MSELPLSIGTMHFTGIGGIGMSGIAEILFELGYDVQGSDILENANVRRLRDKGIPVMSGQSNENVRNASLVVISTAIKSDNPEVVAAREVFVGSLATIYSIDDIEKNEKKLFDKLKSEKRKDGSPVFSIATGLSLMIFYAFSMQCMSTLAVVKRETGSWKWPILQIVVLFGSFTR